MIIRSGIVIATWIGIWCLSNADASPREFHCPPEHDIRLAPIAWEGGYADMPYMVKLPSGKIGMTLTVSDHKEGKDDQHIVWLVSDDKGVSWTKPIPIEPPDGPEASWAMPYVENGRLFVFYTYNSRNIRLWPFTNQPGGVPRVDVVGDLAIRWSDDEGKTWSDRLLVSVPRTSIDMRNGFGGKESLFWLSGAPVRIGEYLYLGLSKAGESLPGNLLPDTEAFLFRTKKILESDSWELVPGEQGFKAPNSDRITEEPSIATFNDKSILVMMRTTSGRILQAFRGSQGWTTDWARYSNGEFLAHPRAKSMVASLRDGTVVLWFHNNQGRSFQDRNPVYVSCAIRKDDKVYWSEPRILLCDPDAATRISYPSLLEIGEQILISETNKKVARIHRFNTGELCRRPGK